MQFDGGKILRWVCISDKNTHFGRFKAQLMLNLENFKLNCLNVILTSNLIG